MKRHHHLGRRTISIPNQSFYGQRYILSFVFMPLKPYTILSGLLYAQADHYILQILYEYYKLPVPARGSSLLFQPLEHLPPMKFARPSSETSTLLGGRTIDPKLCRTNLEMVEVGWNVVCHFFAILRSFTMPWVGWAEVDCRVWVGLLFWGQEWGGWRQSSI